jgi:hypothetical protein
MLMDHDRLERTPEVFVLKHGELVASLVVGRGTKAHGGEDGTLCLRR